MQRTTTDTGQGCMEVQAKFHPLHRSRTPQPLEGLFETASVHYTYGIWQPDRTAKIKSMERFEQLAEEQSSGKSREGPA